MSKCVAQCPCVLHNVPAQVKVNPCGVNYGHLILSQGENVEHAESDTELLKSEQEQARLEKTDYPIIRDK